MSYKTLCEKLIHNKIKLQGKITFADFMDIALYDSNYGYYNSQNRIGATGDFYTSPIVHPAFGSIICKQLFSMWVALKKPSPTKNCLSKFLIAIISSFVIFILNGYK